MGAVQVGGTSVAERNGGGMSSWVYAPRHDGGQRWLATGEGTSARHNAKKTGKSHINHYPDSRSNIKCRACNMKKEISTA